MTNNIEELNENIKSENYPLNLLLWVTLNNESDFLKVRETLTRIGVSSKKEKKLLQSCLPYNSKIQTEDGIKTIKDIVDSKYMGKVLSADQNGNMSYNNIIAHHVKDNDDKKWITLINTNLLSSTRLTCTDDHLVGVVDDCFNPEIKFISAKDTLGKYLVRNPVSLKNKMFNISKIFNKDQIEYLIGTVMGDACITKNGSIQISHCEKQKAYIDEKQELFDGRIVPYLNNKGFGNNKDNPSYVLYINSNEQTKELRNLMYINGKKTIKNILNMITEKSLAYWYMDDGNLTVARPNSNNPTYYAMLNTQGFSKEDNNLLVDMFKSRFNLSPRVDEYNIQYNNMTKTYNRLRFTQPDSMKLFKMIASHVNECMLYKIPEEYRKIERYIKNYKKLDYALYKIRDLRYVTSTYNSPYLYSKLYDIEVENNHNFIANNSLVHNCHILHKRGKYAIVHFKELFALDGKPTNFTDEDKQRRNMIASLLEEWGLITIDDKNMIKDKALMSHIKIIPYKEKNKWILEPKYNIGKKKKSHIF